MQWLTTVRLPSSVGWLLCLSMATSLTASLTLASEKNYSSIQLGPVRREPVAAVFWDDHLAVIACARSGTLIVWDVEAAKIKQEFAVGKQLRGLAKWGDDQLFVIDDKTNELIQLRYADDQLTELQRYSVPHAPISLDPFVDRQGSGLAVASLWGRAITIWRTEGAGMRLVSTIALPFEPRQVVAKNPAAAGIRMKEPGQALRLQAIGAFTGEYGEWSLDGRRTATMRFSSRTEGTGRWNSLGYWADPDGDFLSAQRFNPSLPITLENLTAGRIVTNFLQPLVSGRLDQETIPLGNHQNADPAGVAFTQNAVLVCLAGVDQVWLEEIAPGGKPQRIPVGGRPRVVIALGNTALVLGELDDTITRIETKNPAKPVVKTSLLDPALAGRVLSPAERGERLFFSARMSAGGLMTCHSCHPDGHTNGQLADTLGDNTHGTPKRVLTLRGTRLTDLWSWNGEMKTLQDNVHKSLRDTMHAPEIKPADIDDLVSFLHTLPPVPPLKQQPVDATDAEQVARGKQVFDREGCAHCHVPPLTFTSHAVYDVGLQDEQGLKKFNPPSLRGVGRLKRLFHDNRAASLSDVFETHGHQLAAPLSRADLKDLVRYLESL